MIKGTADSGIEFDIPDILSLLDGEVEAPPSGYYELKSKAVVGSPAPEIKHANMSMRANLRQQLQRQQMLEIEKRERENSLGSLGKQSQTQPQNINGPVLHGPPEVPPKVLQVETPLEHPTQYHIRQNQKRQVQLYLSQSVRDHHMPAHSMPVLTTGASPVDTQYQLSGSAPTDLDSPASHGLGTSHGYEEMDLLSDLISLESVEPAMDNDLNFIEPSLNPVSATLPPSNFLNHFGTLEVESASATSSSSCPPAFSGRTDPPNQMSEEEARLWAKDRQKKDNHNMIERRRRFNINDRIKELGTLLPKNIDPDMRQNKGSILKASVDYIRRLKHDQEKLRSLEERQRQTDAVNRKIVMRLKHLELLMKNHGISTEFADEGINAVLSTMVSPNTLNLHTIKSEDGMTHLLASGASATSQSFLNSVHIDFMDDSSPVSGDPMLTSEPVSPENDDSSGLV